MNKLSYMVLGTVVGASVFCITMNKDMIARKMKMLEHKSKKTWNKVKNMF